MKKLLKEMEDRLGRKLTKKEYYIYETTHVYTKNKIYNELTEFAREVHAKIFVMYLEYVQRKAKEEEDLY